MAAVQAILPIFLVIVLGYWIGRRQWVTQEAADGLSALTFRLLMPLLLFTGIARADLAQGLSPHLLLAYFVPALALFALVSLLAHRRLGRASPLGLAAAYSNNVLIGVPLVAAVLGAQSMVYVFAILVFHSLLLFSVQSLYAAFGAGEKVRAQTLLGNLVNPLIIGLVLGALLNLSGLTLPQPLGRAADWLAGAGLPCALLVLGLGLSRFRLMPNRASWALALAKLLLLPALVFWLAGALGLPDAARAVLVVLAACPSGVNVLGFVRAPEDSRTVSATVFLSTVLAAVGLPLWLTALNL
ncbi:MAG TPA: AEC family transporter [Pseudomonas sp.]|nr:AEC family transporter [Pseudomonas sp.]